SDPGGCDAQGCVAELRGRRVAVAGTLSAALEDCGHSDLVIAFRPLPASRCRGSVLIGGRDLWHQGALALWIEKEGVRIETVRRARGARAWVPDRPAEGEGPKWMAGPRSAAGALNTADKAQPADPEP